MRPSPRRRSRSVTLVGYAGPVVCVLLLAKIHAATVGHYDFTASSRLQWSCAYIAFLWTAIYASGLPDELGGRSPLTAAVGASASSALGVSALQLALGSELLPRFVVFGASFSLLPWLWLWSVLASRARAAGNHDRVVALLDTAEASALQKEIGPSATDQAQIVTVLRDERGSEPSAGRALLDTVLETQASVLVLSRAALLDPSVIRQASELHRAGVHIRDLRQFYEEAFGKVPLTELAQSSLLFDIPELHSRAYLRAKRLIDLTVGLAALPVLALSVPVIFVANLCGNRGPLFFRQVRVGKNGVPFELLKFRSMPVGTSGGNWTVDQDPRLGPVGRWMRRFHVDELPQVVNILRGDLAIVGPRPEQPRYVDQLEASVPFYDARHLLRPGLTGWAQVNYGYGSSEMDAIEKLQYDFFYMRKQSVRLDMRILARTIRSVVQASGQ